MNSDGNWSSLQDLTVSGLVLFNKKGWSIKFSIMSIIMARQVLCDVSCYICSLTYYLLHNFYTQASQLHEYFIKENLIRVQEDFFRPRKRLLPIDLRIFFRGRLKSKQSRSGSQRVPKRIIHLEVVLRQRHQERRTLCPSRGYFGTKA